MTFGEVYVSELFTNVIILGGMPSVNRLCSETVRIEVKELMIIP